MMSMDSEAQQRLRAEYIELLQRTSTLRAFILSDGFEDLPEIDRRDLREQARHMDAYWHVVARRAARHLHEFTGDEI